ncbi:MAG: hypothetical protein GXO60_04330 [Epsilonproteobacteria bacterium]|nr:hypothetical protein [Campylobacterota bacterium]
MDDKIKLFKSKYIDITMGLKYLNHNEKLYLQILKNFVTRYQDLDVESLDDDRLKDTLHTIKGLSATLGMSELSELAESIYETRNRDRLSEFSMILQLIMDELKTKLIDKKQKTILIINDKVIDIDILFELLVDTYDIIVALDKESALEAIEGEDISMILLESDMLHVDALDIYDSIKSRMIPTVFIMDSLENKSINFDNFVTKPFNKKELINYINSH